MKILKNSKEADVLCFFPAYTITSKETNVDLFFLEKEDHTTYTHCIYNYITFYKSRGFIRISLEKIHQKGLDPYFLNKFESMLYVNICQDEYSKFIE